MTRLGDLLRIVHGFGFEGSYFTDQPTNWVLMTPGNFRIGGGFQGSKLKYYDGPIPHGFVLEPGDLVVTMTDLSKEGDTLGYPAVVPPTEGYRLLHNQRIGKVVIYDETRLDRRFAYYLLKTKGYRDHVVSGASGSTVKHTSPSRIEAYCVTIPEIDKQIEVANVLGTLDDKIELNRQMTNTLDEMARALFRSWFVDYDPVKIKVRAGSPVVELGIDAAIARNFPNALSETNLGPTPLGWEISLLIDLTNRISRGITPDYADEGILVLNQKCVRDRQIDWTKARRHSASGRKTAGREVIREDVLINSTGVGTLGRVAQVVDLPETAIADTHITIVRPAPDKIDPIYLGMNLTGRESEIEALGEGSTGQTELSRTMVGQIEVVVPPRELQQAFSNIVRPMIKMQSSLAAESTRLADMRDYLLPRLLSGELAVRTGGLA